MVFEHIEKLKQEYTDKYVQIESDRPELARFRNVTGQVKSVNMSGRALVEFIEYHANIGWYDIGVDYLKVVDKPEPAVKQEKVRPAAKKKAPVAKKPEKGEEKLSPLELARMQGAAKKEGAQLEKKMSVAEMLEAARSEKQGSTAETKAPALTEKAPPSEKPKSDRSKMSVADMIAAARAEKSGGAAPAESPAPAAPEEKAPAPEKPKPDRSKMSVADVIAAARAEKSGGAAPAESPAPAAPEAKAPAPEKPKPDRSKMSVADVIAAARAEKNGGAAPAEPVEEKVAEEPAAQEAEVEETPTPQEAPAPAAAGPVDRSTMSVDEIIAWCREHDSK